MANEACDAGRVVINGKVAKASADVKAGDVIEIAFGNKSVKVRVTDVKDTVKKEEAAETESTLADNLDPDMAAKLAALFGKKED